jgi:DNA repair protein RadC
MPENLEQRRLRLQRVLEPICDRNEFTSQDIQLVCHEMTPQFVTQILNQLAQEGILQCEALGPKRFFRWQQARDSFVPHAWINRQLTTQLTAAPAEDRPRERLLSLGADKLRTAELIAILIRTGRKGESALMAGEKVATHFASDIGRMRDASPTELREVSTVVSSGVYCQIMAGIELGRRVTEALERNESPPEKIDSTATAIDYCQRKFRRLAIDRQQEEFHIVTLDTKLFPIATHQITVGTLDASLVHPREVFRPAIRDAASAIILVHNHPSGDSTPSREDIAVTERLRKSAEIIGIRVLDHIVVGSDNCTSIAEWEGRR